MARISLNPPRSLTLRLGEWYSRRRYGKVLEPGLAYGHNPRVLMSYARLETSVEKWKALDERLKHLAVMASAARLNCSWCMDFGHWLADGLGLPAEKIRAVPAWREHPGVFTDIERDVMEFAEAMTETEPVVTDEMAAALVRRLGEPAFVELVAIVALENMRSRANLAFGLTSQGFSETCAVRSAA